MAKKQYMRLRTHEGAESSGYLELSPFRTDGNQTNFSRTVLLHNLIPDYHGPGLLLDLDNEGRAMGIEIIYPDDDDDDDSQSLSP